MLIDSEAPAPDRPAAAPDRGRRVAVLINDMNAAGGIQRAAVNLVRALAPHHRTMLLSVEPLAAPVFHDPALEFRSLGYKRRARTRRSLVWELAAVGRRLRRFVAENRIDLVIAIWYDWATVCAFALPRGVAAIGWEHISYFEATRTWRWIRSKSFPRLDAVVCLTEEDRPRFTSFCGRVEVLANWAEPAAPAPVAAREKILLTVGHLNGRKGLDRLLWALKQPLTENPDWKLVVVGGGEKGHVDWGYMDYIATLLQTLRIGSQVDFHPATPRIEEWYRRASVYVMGSRQEGLPMVLIEAKAHGLPIVSFDCPTGPKEIIRPGVDGFLVQNDSLEFGRAAQALMTDPALRSRMAAAAVEDFHARFVQEAVLPEWLRLIDSLPFAGDAGRDAPAPGRLRQSTTAAGAIAALAAGGHLVG